MNWKSYEKEILTYFQESYPDCIFHFDKKILGKYSKVLRQIDILIEGEVAGYEIKIIVDCKHFSKSIDVKQVESFCSMVDDVDAHQGVLVTKKGYSKAAINRAYYGNQKIELDIINLDDIKELQSIDAVPYTGNFGIIIPAPFGWVLDWENKVNSFATLHQRGITLLDAQKRQEWMYMQFWKKENSIIDIENLISFQNKNIIEVDKGTIFSYNTSAKRGDEYKTKIRIADVPKYPSLEITGFIQFEDYIFFIVLFSPKELLNKNLRKLQYLLKIAIPSTIKFDNLELIQNYITELELINDLEDKAQKYYQIGLWYKEMNNNEKALENFKTAIECFPKHYLCLKIIIKETLFQELYDETKIFSKLLFEIQPKNPAILQDLLEIYLNQEKVDLVIILFKELINSNRESEILGNLNYHLGVLNFDLNKDFEARKYIFEAKQQFKMVLPSSHQVFDAINFLENNRK